MIKYSDILKESIKKRKKKKVKVNATEDMAMSTTANVQGHEKRFGKVGPLYKGMTTTTQGSMPAQSEGIIDKITISVTWPIKMLLYKFKAVLQINKAFTNVFVAIMNKLEDMVTSGTVKDRFYWDLADLTRKVETAEITSPEEFLRQYNELLSKYGYREYEIYQ